MKKMKITNRIQIISILILTLISLNTNSQNNNGLSLENTYLNFGLNFGYIKYKTDQQQQPDFKYNPNLGIRMGVESDFYKINDKLSLETGLTLVLSRYEIDKLDYTYLSFMIGTHLLTKYSYKKFNFGIGPYLNYGLIGKQTVPSGNTYDFYTGNDQQQEAPIKRLDIGLDMKLNYSLKWNLIDDIYISYRLGLNNIENTEAPSGVEQSSKNRFISLGIRSNLSDLLNKI